MDARKKALMKFAGSQLDLNLEGEWQDDGRAIAAALVELSDAVKSLLVELEEDGFFTAEQADVGGQDLDAYGTDDCQALQGPEH